MGPPSSPSLCPHPGALEPARSTGRCMLSPGEDGVDSLPPVSHDLVLFHPTNNFQSFCVNFSQLDLCSFGVPNSAFCSGYRGLQKCGKGMLFALLLPDALWVLEPANRSYPHVLPKSFFGFIVPRGPGWPAVLLQGPSLENPHTSPHHQDNSNYHGRIRLWKVAQ